MKSTGSRTIEPPPPQSDFRPRGNINRTLYFVSFEKASYSWLHNIFVKTSVWGSWLIFLMFPLGKLIKKDKINDSTHLELTVSRNQRLLCANSREDEILLIRSLHRYT